MSAAMSSNSASAETVVDRLIEDLRAKDMALDGQERPAAILWTDPGAEWRPLVEAMQTRVEELLVLGDYAPDRRTGPAIWIRCLVDRTLDEPALPERRAPILYLPGVARQDLRAGEECREDLKPLVELMFRGTLWLQHNGSDWGVRTFLTSTRSLGLDIAGDRATTQAMLRALPEVAVSPVAQLSGRRLEADDFDQMLRPDVVRDVLRWMGDPDSAKARMTISGWGAFCSRCRDELDYDPETEADVTAGGRLGAADGPWAKVWERFEEAPRSYPGVDDLLGRSRPTDRLPMDRDHWPDLNQEDEGQVRKALQELPQLGHLEACDSIANLEKTHGQRREWVWARMDRSPMAGTLEPLCRLAEAARSAIGGSTPDDVAATYRERGWQGDAASWEAVAAAPVADEALVSGAVHHLLTPWLEDSARAFQKALENMFLPGRGEQQAVSAGDNGCVLFCDGLRYDLGQRLVDRLEGAGCSVTPNHRWAAVPTVTATAKPAVTPVADAIVGGNLEEDFGARFDVDGKPANAANLRKALARRDYQILGTGAFDAPMEPPARGWMECGEIDGLGHDLGGRLARQLGEELDRLAERILGLLNAGWESVRVVTDHGWLLVPGGLPKVDLPKHLTESRWARCAVIAGSSTPDVPRFPWHWNETQSFATAPGIACFNKTEEYAHGGLSIQECLVPDLLVVRGGSAGGQASIEAVTWRQMRCQVQATTTGAGVLADLRLRTPAGSSVAVEAKPIDEDGRASLLLDGDEHEDAQLVIVLVDEAGTILSHRSTRVGDDS